MNALNVMTFHEDPNLWAPADRRTGWALPLSTRTRPRRTTPSACQTVIGRDFPSAVASLI